MKPAVRGFVRKGKLLIDEPRLLQAFEGCEVDITRREYGRSSQANRFYWGVVLREASEYTGDTPEDLHEYFKRRFLPKAVCIAKANGEVIDDAVVGGSTTKLTVAEFSEYIERVRHFLITELGLEIAEEVAS